MSHRLADPSTLWFCKAVHCENYITEIVDWHRRGGGARSNDKFVLRNKIKIP